MKSNHQPAALTADTTPRPALPAGAAQHSPGGSLQGVVLEPADGYTNARHRVAGPYVPALPQQLAAPYPYASPPQIPAATRMNPLAIFSLVLAFIFCPAAVVMSHFALRQIKRTGEDGRGVAIAGLCVGYAYLAVIVVGVIVAIVTAATGAPYSGGPGSFH